MNIPTSSRDERPKVRGVIPRKAAATLPIEISDTDHNMGHSQADVDEVLALSLASDGQAAFTGTTTTTDSRYKTSPPQAQSSAHPKGDKRM